MTVETPRQKAWTARRITRCALCIALLAIGARVSFPLPFYPVQFSLQTFVVLLTGLLLSPQDAFVATAAYMGLGLAGLPLFTTGGGPSYILQPSFGYIISFIMAAPICAWINQRLRSRWAPLLGCIAATLCITFFGAVYFAALNRWVLHTPIGMDTFLWMCFIYLPLDTTKMMGALIAQPLLRKGLGSWL